MRYPPSMIRSLVVVFVVIVVAVAGGHQTARAATPLVPPASAGMPGSKNKPERLEWFRDLGFGLFIHWNVDSQLGSDISHSMVAADEDYLRRYIEELPRTFNPPKFTPQDWAVLAKLAGARYVVFTTKHHSGFCMWPTHTTDFNIANTPFKRDITGELLDAFAAQGLARGVYFSPDDFWWLHKNGKTLQRRIADVQPVHCSVPWKSSTIRKPPRSRYSRNFAACASVRSPAPTSPEIKNGQ